MNQTTKNIKLAVSYAEEMKVMVSSCCESVKDASSVTEAWGCIDKCYQDIEALRNHQKCTGSKSFSLKNVINNDVEGHTKYLQGVNVPIAVNCMVSDDNELLPSDVAEMHIGTVDGKTTLLITPSCFTVPIESINAYSFEAATILNETVPVLICDMRIFDKSLSDEYEVFNLRGCDNDPMMPATLEKNVSVNWCGSVITLKSANISEKLKEKGFIDIKNDINYAADFTQLGPHFKDDGKGWSYYD